MKTLKIIKGVKFMNQPSEKTMLLLLELMKKASLPVILEKERQAQLQEQNKGA